MSVQKLVLHRGGSMYGIHRLLGLEPSNPQLPIASVGHQETRQPPVDTGQSNLDDLREQIRKDVASGFLDENAILTSAADIFDVEIDAAVVCREAPRLLRAVLAEQVAPARGWPDRTDCDRLDAAFAALEAGGIVSRQNFTCCGNYSAHENLGRDRSWAWPVPRLRCLRRGRGGCG